MLFFFYLLAFILHAFVLLTSVFLALHLACLNSIRRFYQWFRLVMLLLVMLNVFALPLLGISEEEEQERHELLEQVKKQSIREL